MTKAPYKRRQIVVDRKFQLGITAKFIAWIGFYLFTFMLIAITAPLAVAMLTGPGTESLSSVTRDIFFLLKKLSLPLVLTGACMVVHCIVLLHKIAGPVFRFRKRFEALKDGDLESEVHLRDGDQLQELAECCNTAVAALRTDVVEAKEAAEALLAESRVLAHCDSIQAEDLKPLVAHGERLAAVLDRLRTGAPGPERVAVVEAEPAEAPAEAEVSA